MAEARRQEEESDRGFWEWLGVGGKSKPRKVDPELYAALDLPPPPTVDDIEAAFRRKARECHPDHGGSDEAMARLIAAREQLLAMA